jgi:peptidoglycan hydrolase CwlO-like protein
VGENKRLRKQIAGLNAKVDEHILKTAEELRKPNPEEGLIRKWKGEIQEWQKQIEVKQRRLKRKRR